jgi:hypothetical protein
MSDPAAKETTAITQTIHPLDSLRLNFQKLSFMEASFLSPQNTEFMLDEFMLPPLESFCHAHSFPRPLTLG